MSSRQRQRMAETRHLYTVVWRDQSKRLIVWSCRVLLVVILSFLLRILWSPSDTLKLSNRMKQQEQETGLQYKLAQEGETRAGSRFIRYVASEILENATTKTVTVQRWAELLVTDGKFSDSLTQVLNDAPFSAFFFETKGVTITSVSQMPFEFVIIEAPHLSSFAESRPDPDSFAEHFEKFSSAACCAFPNLGGDAMLVAPIHRNPNIPLAAYSHLAKFVRAAPTDQVRGLWQLTAKTYRERWTAKPLWLSTEGSGVAWLHMRLDSRPKYYHYQPFAMS